jgi:hypothetical protein
MVTMATLFGPKGSKTLEFNVQDTGMGIEHKDFGKLFQKFQQIDSALNRAAGGTGLGLAISKEIVDLHGGRIWVESEPGRGSTFHMTLPIDARVASAYRRYVLTVMGDRELEEQISHVLGKRRFDVGHVMRGEEVLDSMSRAQPRRTKAT